MATLEDYRRAHTVVKQMDDPGYYEDRGEQLAEDYRDDLGRAELCLEYASHKFKVMSDVMTRMYDCLVDNVEGDAPVEFKRDLVCLGVLDLDVEEEGTRERKPMARNLIEEVRDLERQVADLRELCRDMHNAMEEHGLKLSDWLVKRLPKED